MQVFFWGFLSVFLAFSVWPGNIETMQQEFIAATQTTVQAYHFEFFLMLALALVGTRLPVVRRPLMWFEVYFHEISHGLATLFTFGRPVKLELHWRGSGLLVSRGGLSVPILFAGYSGAVLWGLLIYLCGVYSNTHTGEVILTLLLVLIGLTVLLLVRNITTLLILLIIAGTLFAPFHLQQTHLGPVLLQFIGLSVGLNAIKAPLHLIDGKSEGDGAELFKRTLIPEGVWILLWFSLGVLGILYMWQLPLPPEARTLVFLPFLT